MEEDDENEEQKPCRLGGAFILMIPPPAVLFKLRAATDDDDDVAVERSRKLFGRQTPANEAKDSSRVRLRQLLRVERNDEEALCLIITCTSCYCLLQCPINARNISDERCTASQIR